MKIELSIEQLEMITGWAEVIMSEWSLSEWSLGEKETKLLEYLEERIIKFHKKEIKERCQNTTRKKLI